MQELRRHKGTSALRTQHLSTVFMSLLGLSVYIQLLRRVKLWTRSTGLYPQFSLISLYRGDVACETTRSP